MEDLKQQYLDDLKCLSNLEYHDEIKIAELTENINGMSIKIRKKEKLLQQEQWAYLSTHPSKRLHSFCFDDDDEDYTSAITPDEPVLSTEELDSSLSMGDEHLDTISATESDEVIKSSVQNLIPILNQIEDFSESNEEISSTDDDSFSIDNIDYVEASPPDPELVSSEVMDIVIPEEFADELAHIISLLEYDCFNFWDLPDPDELMFVLNSEIRENLPSATSASPPDSELVSSEVMEIVIPEVGGIDDDILLTIKDNNLCEKLLNVYLLIANIEALKDNPTPSSKLLTKSSSTSLKSFLEETKNFHNSLPEFENFYFDLEEISSGSTTTHSDISLPDYEAFYFDDDHIEEMSGGSTTTHSDISLSKYDSFVFGSSNDQFPPTDRSDFTHEEFADELAHIISPPEYDRFYFWNLPIRYSQKLKDSCQRILSSKSSFPQLQLGIMFLIASRFPTPPLACAFLIPRATVKQVDYWFKFSYPPSDTPVCHLCTYEQCGNILSYGTCLNCNSRTGNSFTYDPIPESFDEKIPACCDDDDDYNSAITPNEPVDSLNIGNEHLNTISATESDEFIKSCVENLVPNPSESEGENGCDVPACFTTFLNILFDAEYEFKSVDNQSLSDENFPEKIFSNPLFQEEINSMKIDPHHFNAESDLIESMLNHDSSIISSSSKIDSLLDEFAGELTLLKSIPPGIDKIDHDPEEEIRVLPRDCCTKTHLLDSDSRMEEIYLSFNPDEPMPPSIEEDDDNSERDILIHEELPSNYSLSLPVNESFHFDIPLFSRPPAKPPDGNTGILNVKMVGDVFEQKPSAKYPMMIHGKNIPILDVPLFHFYPLDQLKYGGNWVRLSDLKQALRGRHPMLISSLVFLFSS
nr:hypothetical protein [Tanacetum cinerariifolium]